MHALPEKLNEHRQKLEATFKAQLLEQRAALEQKIEDAVDRASLKALQSSETELAPRIETLQQRMDKEIGLLSAMLHDVQGSAKKDDKKSIESTFIGQIQDLRLELSHIKVDIPRLRESVEESTKAIRPLQDLVRDNQKVHGSFQEEIQTALGKLQEKIEDEVRRAEATESTWGVRLQDLAARCADERRNIEERGRRQAADAMQHAAAVEERLRCCLDRLETSMTERSQQHAQDVATTLRPEIEQAMDFVHQQVEDRHTRIQVQTAEMDRQLRDEIKACRIESVTRADDAAAKRISELNSTLSLKLDEASRDVAVARKAHHDALTSVNDTVSARVEEVSGFLQGRLQQLEQAAEAAQGSAREAMLWAEQSAMRTAERCSSFDDALALVREAIIREREERERQEASARKEAQESVEGMEESFDRRLKEMGARCTSVSEAALAEVSKSLRHELLSWKQAADDRADTVQREVRSTLTQEVAARKGDLAQLDDVSRRQIQSATVEMQAGQASLKAELSARMEGVQGRIDECLERVQKWETQLEMNSLHQSDASKRCQDDIVKSTQKLEASITETGKALQEQLQRSSEKTEAQLQELCQEHARLEALQGSEASRLETALQDKVTADQLQEGVKAAMEKAAEATAIVGSVETALHRQQGAFEAEARQLAAQCHAAQAEACEAKGRMQRETSTLGSELTQVRAATTSLMNGVVKTLQVLGLLKGEVEVLPPRGQDNRALLVNRRWGIDISDLLEWEKSGQSLAVRVAQVWHPYEAAEVPSLLALVDRKANEGDLRMLRAAIGGTHGSSMKLSSLGGPPWTQQSVPWTLSGGEVAKADVVETGASMCGEGVSEPQAPMAPRRSPPAPRTAR